MKTVQEILKASGYDVDGMDNRNRAVRSINSVLKNSDINLFVNQKGKVWVGTDQFRYNVKLGLDGVGGVRYKTNNVSPYGLLVILGNFLRIDAVKSKIYSETSEPCTCSKCEGTGYLPCFAYYADGVCFDCMGVGSVGKLMVQNVQKQTNLKGRQYVNKFRVSANYAESFPKDVENIKPIGYIGHPTAEEFLSKKGDMFYIHQPVCQANGWYEIPASEFEKFRLEYNKLCKKEIL